MAFLSLFAAVLAAILWLVRPGLGLLRLRVIAPLAGATLLAASLFALWYFHRPQPPPAKKALFKGISYERDVRSAPRPIVAHVVTIDLRAPSISFLVTPGDPSRGLDARAATTSEVLTRTKAQLVVNGDFFLPWWSHGPQDYYPHSGEPVYVLGLAISSGQAYGRRQAPCSTLVFKQDGTVAIVEVKDATAPLPRARHAISGKQLIVSDGAVTAQVHDRDWAKQRHPRTAVALDRTGSALLLVAVDGRQPGYSEGSRSKSSLGSSSSTAVIGR